MNAPRIVSASFSETPQARTVSYQWPTCAFVSAMIFSASSFCNKKRACWGKNIFRVREPTLISTHQRQIAAVEAYDGRRSEVVRGRQRPVNVSGQEGMVARMVVKVGNKGIEANAAEEFASIFVRLCDDAAHFLDKEDIRPSLSCFVGFVRAQHGESAHHARACSP